MGVKVRQDVPFFQNVVTRTAEGIITVGEKGTIVFANDAVEGLVGYSAEELTDMSLGTIFDSVHETPMEAIQREAIDGAREERSSPVTLVHRNGSPIEATLAVKRSEYADDRYFTLTIQRDNENEGAAPMSEPYTVQRIATKAFEHSPDPIIVFDCSENEIIECSPSTCDLLGYERDELRTNSSTVIYGDQTQRFIDFTRLVLGTGDPRTEHFSVVTADGESLTVAVSAVPVNASRELVFIYLRDISERVAIEQEAERLTEGIEAAIDGIAILDEDWEYRYLNDAHTQIYGYNTPSELVGESWQLLYEDEEQRRFEKQILPAVEQSGSWSGEAVGLRADGETFPQELSLSSIDTGGYVCIVRDITERKKSARIDKNQLEELNEASRELTIAENKRKIAEIGLQTLDRLFDYEVACVRLHDPDENALQLISATETAKELLATEPAFNLESTFAGQALRQGDTIHRTPDEAGSLAETPITASLHVPLGGYGTLTVAYTESTTFSDAEIEGTKMLAADIEAALSRADRERALREQTEDLRQQRDQLETIAQINSLIHELVDDVLEASSQSDIEERVCERLADSALYQSAWIGELEITGEHLNKNAAAGEDNLQVATTDELPVESVADGIVESAIESGSVVSDHRYQIVESNEQSSDALTATAAVPIQFGERTFGALVVHAATEDAFCAVETESLRILGDIIGFTLNAVQNRQLLFSDEMVQLEFEVTGGDCLAVAVSDELNCHCQTRQTVQSNDDRFLSYLEVDGVPAEQAAEVTNQIDSVLDCRVITENEDSCVLEVKREQCGATVMMEYGATIRRADAKNGVGSLVIEAPRKEDIREIAKAYEQYNTESELVAKHDVERAGRTVAEFREAISDKLTEKQLAAIKTAYSSGYYDWPRKSTAEDIATAMGISSATLHQHLRSAHRQILDGFINNTR